MSYTERAMNAYEECAFWADAPRNEEGNEETEHNGLADEARAEMLADVTAFVEAEWDDVSAIGAEQVGHDFWLTRNRHGAGFWDRGLGDVGDRLTTAAEAYGSSDLYVGDDGKVYVS